MPLIVVPLVRYEWNGRSGVFCHSHRVLIGKCSRRV
jgi:hypothetical protein